MTGREFALIEAIRARLGRHSDRVLRALGEDAAVVKADGLAAGKGVKVCRDATEAKEFLFEVMEKEMFGSAGSTHSHSHSASRHR